MPSFSEPPSGWAREVPRYRATRDVYPSPNDRHRLEPPFSSFSNPDVWQFAEKPISARSEFESKSWPHPSFWPMNTAAKRVLDFFNSRQKSRLALSPWQGDRLVLDDGLTGPTQPKFSIKTGVTAA
jgi:hypothetical protein